MKFDFDKVISRKGTHSTKWESGGHGGVQFDENSLAFSIADMDFAVAPQIVEALKKQLSEMDALITAKEQLLIEMESYKKSVIYEYVTGKKEVPACQ